MNFLRSVRNFLQPTQDDPVQRLSRADLLARADFIAQRYLRTTRHDAFARLNRGELAGSIAEPELMAVRDMLRSLDAKR